MPRRRAIGVRRSCATLSIDSPIAAISPLIRSSIVLNSALNSSTASPRLARRCPCGGGARHAGIGAAGADDPLDDVDQVVDRLERRSREDQPAADARRRA